MQPANPTTPLDVIAEQPRLDHVDETLGRKMGRDAQRVSRGELDEEVFVELWRDGAPLGSCNGQKDFTESLEGSLVARSPIGVAFGTSSDVGDADGQRVLSSVSPGQSRCIAFGWEFPESTATNRSQGDGVEFDLVFGAVPAGGASPFTSTEASE